MHEISRTIAQNLVIKHHVNKHVTVYKLRCIPLRHVHLLRGYPPERVLMHHLPVPTMKYVVHLSQEHRLLLHCRYLHEWCLYCSILPHYKLYVQVYITHILCYAFLCCVWLAPSQYFPGKVFYIRTQYKKKKGHTTWNTIEIWYGTFSVLSMSYSIETYRMISVLQWYTFTSVTL